MAAVSARPVRPRLGHPASFFRRTVLRESAGFQKPSISMCCLRVILRQTGPYARPADVSPGIEIHCVGGKAVEQALLNTCSCDNWQSVNSLANDSPHTRAEFDVVNTRKNPS